ncbi:hypothetical protein K469DRAFT_398280 [Zopfia rhizophila CBS 207.26]|uniref:Uncharacterized protein n=1 Tax=Zopfia rhizophila CBS 207.26 TaxID=1314779 RepID=A0A6A6DCF1_9PEZI|nr:hypothetical protein K469DRAFT_398280 [Zopfia rhizophila CBS 207.26]
MVDCIVQWLCDVRWCLEMEDVRGEGLVQSMQLRGDFQCSNDSRRCLHLKILGGPSSGGIACWIMIAFSAITSLKEYIASISPSHHHQPMCRTNARNTKQIYALRQHGHSRDGVLAVPAVPPAFQAEQSAKLRDGNSESRGGRKNLQCCFSPPAKVHPACANKGLWILCRVSRGRRSRLANKEHSPGHAGGQKYIIPRGTYLFLTTGSR